MGLGKKTKEGRNIKYSGFKKEKKQQTRTGKNRKQSGITKTQRTRREEEIENRMGFKNSRHEGRKKQKVEWDLKNSKGNDEKEEKYVN